MEEEKEPENEKDQTQKQSAMVDPQTGSLLFQRLPQELRDHIFRLFFSNTRFMFDSSWWRTVRPAPNGLALLLVCRRARLEIGKSWLHYVLFCYGCPGDMLNKLTGLSIDTLSQIRHIRVTGTHVRLPGPGYSETFYPLVSTLKILPGLQLDQLTVLDGMPERFSYDVLNRLIVEGNGWKTLRYICEGSRMLGFAYLTSDTSPEARPRYSRKLQPMHWQIVMESRDGVASNPSVTIYRGKEELRIGCLGTVLDPSKRVKFEQKLWEGLDCEPGIFPEDPELMTGLEPWKEMLIIVKRGSSIDYEEKKGSPFAEMDLDLRRDYPGKTWHQIRAESRKVVVIVDNDDNDDLGIVGIVDEYEDVDEYYSFSYDMDKRSR
jgi:hypothetical protein